MIWELILIAVLPFGLSAQMGSTLEAKMVRVKIDMPATQQGVDLYPDREQPLELNSHQRRLKEFGIAVRSGDTIMVTKVKLKDKAIEVHLGGGGYGTFWDETATTTASTAYKSSGERSLEDRLRSEKDPNRRRSLESELRSARRERERRNDRERAYAVQATEAKAQRIANKRLDAGSRFNIKFEGMVAPEAVSPEMIRKALEAYVSFDSMR